MERVNLEKIMILLQKMSSVELKIAEFYRTCADILDEDRDFWLSLEKQEIKHADNMKKMANIVYKKCDLFETGRPFHPMAVDTIIKGLENDIRRMKEGDLTVDKALAIARDIENSLIEARYAEIVKTNDIEYKGLVEEIVNDTLAHKGWIEKKIQKQRKQT